MQPRITACAPRQGSHWVHSPSVNPHLKQHNKQTVCVRVRKREREKEGGVGGSLFWHVAFAYLFITIIYATCDSVPDLRRFFSPQPYADHYEQTILFTLSLSHLCTDTSHNSWKQERLNSECVCWYYKLCKYEQQIKYI